MDQYAQLRLKGITPAVEQNEVIEAIQQFGKISEVGEVRTFTGYYEGLGEVQVTIRDRGEGAGAARYSVAARPLDVDADSEYLNVHGNPEADLNMAIQMAHWGNLEKLAQRFAGR